MNQPFLRFFGNFFDIGDLANEFSNTDYNWFVMKNVNILKSQTTTDEEKISALKHVGNLAYIGTKEKSVQVVACVMPLMLVWLKHWHDLNPVLQKPLLQSLSMLAHRSRLAQEMVYDDPSVMPIVAKLITNAAEASTCRWVCHFLLHLISDSGKLLTACAGNEELNLALTKATRIPWDDWHGSVNLASKLLQLLSPK